MVLKWSSVGDVLLRSGVNLGLPLAGFYPYSQNRCSDAVKIVSFSITSKLFENKIFLTQFVNFLVGGIPGVAALELQHTGRKT